MSRAVYTLRDYEGWVRYVGSTQNPATRMVNHANADTDVGKLIRKERKAKRDLTMHVEEWYADGSAGFAAEKDYIYGYSQLSGERLLNRVSSKPIPNVFEKCILSDCKNKAKKEGLCSGCHWEYSFRLHGMPSDLQSAYRLKCIELGMLVADPDDDEDAVDFADVQDIVFKEAGVDPVPAKKPAKRSTNPFIATA